MPHPGTVGFALIGPLPTYATNPTSWANVVAAGLHLVATGASALSESDFTKVETRLNQLMAMNPEAFLEVQLGQGVDPTSVQGADALIDLFSGLVDALTGAGSGAARNIVSTLTETRNRIETQTSVTTENVTGSSVTNTGENVVQFIDIMTPEEFLDNFQTGFTTYADSLFRVGQIDRATMNFMIRNPGTFFTAYTAELGRRADQGEQIFEVVGLDGAAELLGERFGGAQALEGTTITEEERISDTEITELINETINRLTNTSTDGIPQTIQETITQLLNNVFKLHQTTTTRAEFHNIANTLTVEQVFGRPNLTTVAILSPIDFLQENFSPITIANLAAIEVGGQVQRAPTGAAPSAPRRLR